MTNIQNTPHILRFFPRRHLLLLAAFVMLAMALSLLPSKSDQRISIPVKLEQAAKPPASAAEEDASPPQRNWRWEEETVKSGDSLALIFQRVGISATVLHHLINSAPEASQLTKIFPGHKIRFAFNRQNELVALQYIPSRLERLDIQLQDDGDYQAEKIAREPEIQLAYHHATLDDSLFLAGQEAGIPQGMIMQIANIFSGVIDFVYDPRKGDRFDVLYEEQYLDGERIGNGKLLAASYQTADDSFTAYRYEFENGSSGYFNADGASMRKPFMRAPLDFARVSSEFNLRRRHPIHKKIRAHRGIDYAAPTGTPVFAAGDGRVARAGYSRANGNYVFISHGTNYTTKYIHLNKRYVRTGQEVKQRTVIGTVGSTGYATGPHLHYEFLVNGVHRNPRTVLKILPSADPIPEDEKPRFNRHVRLVQNQYQQMKQQFAMHGQTP